MKIIDKTPFQNAQGKIDFSGRIQGSLKYGFDWYSGLEAQKTVIEQLDRSLEKGFVLIRNFTLPNSDIVIPIILIGPGGMSVIYVTQVKGFFEAKGDQWNTLNNGKAQPASVNLLSIVTRLARALQVYLDRQKIELPAPIDPALIAANPGAHIDSMRPAIRVVLSDAIKQFAISLTQARPVLRPEFIYELADRIIEPLPPEAPEEQAPKPASAAQIPASPERAPSRAKAIFNASEQVQPFNPSDLGFAFEEENADGIKSLRETSPAQPLPKQPAPKKGKILGMSGKQVALLAAIFIVECCVLAIGAGVIYYLNR
jgi:hypothetical protein